jgi:hypothetical protein
MVLPDKFKPMIPMKLTHKIGLIYLKAIILLILSFHSNGVEGQRLNPFLSETAQVANGAGAEPLPYSNTFSLFDGIPETASTRSKELQFYIVLPGDIQELGFRLLAPAPSFYYPFPGDFVTPCSENKEYNQLQSMEPDLVLEYALYADSTTAFAPDKKIIAWIDSGAKSLYDENFASGNNGSKSVVKRSVRKWSNELIRLTIRDKKDKKLSGSFLLQTGTVPSLKGIKLKTSIEALRSE